MTRIVGFTDYLGPSGGVTSEGFYHISAKDAIISSGADIYLDSNPYETYPNRGKIRAQSHDNFNLVASGSLGLETNADIKLINYDSSSPYGVVIDDGNVLLTTTEGKRATLSGSGIATLDDIYSPTQCIFFARLSDNISIAAGEAEVSLTWNALKKENFTFSDGTSTLTVVETGKYIIDADIGNNMDVGGLLQRIYLYYSDGAEVEEVYARRYNTTSHIASGNALHMSYQKDMSAGDTIRLTASVSNTMDDAFWTAQQCVWRVFKVE